MEVEEENAEASEIEEVNINEGASCTIDTKAIQEPSAGQDLEFCPEFTVNTEGHVTISELDTGSLKRKHLGDVHIEGSVSKAAHVDPQPSDEYDAVNSLVTIATPVPLTTSQEGTLHVTCHGCQADVNITTALAAITGQANHEPTLLPSTPTPEVQQDRVNQAWFTTKVDKDTLHDKGMKWKQGMWSKEENELLNCNILEYCKLNNIADPNVVIFSMTKDERKDFYRTVAKGIRRPLFAIYRRVLRMYDRRNYIGKYSNEEVEQLKALKEKHGNDWATIGHAMGRSASSVKDRFRLLRESCLSGKWTSEEEERLSQAVHEVSGTQPGDSITGGIAWAVVAEKVATRSEKQCRSKWLNYLNWKEKGGKEWTKKDEIKLINRIYELDVNDENLINWQNLMANWTSVRSPQWLRSKWWALKKHCPLSIATFREQVEYLRNHWVDTLQTKIERQETRFKSGRASLNYMATPRQTAHTTALSTSSIAHTITVNSDGTITTVEDDGTAQGRYEVVAVNTLADSTYQGQGRQPSYIIHSVQPSSIAPGQAYLIQQPALEMMRHVDTSPVHSEQVQLSSQGVVMTATVLNPHQAVRTLPGVSPELAQAIVQTDISGPITASDLEPTHHHLPSHSGDHAVEMTLQQSGNTHIQGPITQEMDATTTIIDPAEVVAAVPRAQMGVVADTLQKAADEQRSETYQQVGPAAIAQSLDGTDLSVSTVTQQISQIPLSQAIQVSQISGTLGQSFPTYATTTTSVAEIAGPVIRNDTLHVANEELSASSSSEGSYGVGSASTRDDAASQHSLHTVDSDNIACNAEVSHHALQQSSSDTAVVMTASDVTPQAVLPEQFLQTHADDPEDLPLSTSDKSATAISVLQPNIEHAEVVTAQIVPISDVAMATTVVSETPSDHLQPVAE